MQNKNIQIIAVKGDITKDHKVQAIVNAGFSMAVRQASTVSRPMRRLRLRFGQPGNLLQVIPVNWIS